MKLGIPKKSLIVEDEKSLLTAWGLKIFAWGIKTWETSAGEMRLRIFNLLGSDPVGRKFTQSVDSGVLDCMPKYWGIILAVGEIEGVDQLEF